MRMGANPMRFSNILTLLFLCFAVTDTAASPAPEFGFQWGFQGPEPGRLSRPSGIAVDPLGQVWVSDANRRIQVFTRDGHFLREWYLGVSPGRILLHPDGGLVFRGSDYQIMRLAPDGSVVWKRPPPPETSGMGIDDEGNVYFTGHSRTVKWNEDGDQVLWSSVAGRGEIHGQDGRIYVLHESVIVVFDSDLNYLDVLRLHDGEGHALNPRAFTVDERGDLTVVASTRSGSIHRFSAQGTWEWTLGPRGSDPREEPDALIRPVDVAVGPFGDVYVTDYDGHVVKMYGTVLPGDDPPPPPTLPGPPPPPPPTPGHPAAILLHLGPEAPNRICLELFDADEIVTSGQGSAEGVSYRAYVVGTPDSRGPDNGLTGFRLGIEYAGFEPEDLRIDGWTLCATLDFPTADWPASESGNTMTWSRNNCQVRELVVAGYFDVTVFGSAVMRARPYPDTDVAKLASCAGAELDIDVDAVNLGWVSLNGPGAAIGGGCNPLLGPCATTPTHTVSWGRLKSLYD